MSRRDKRKLRARNQQRAVLVRVLHDDSCKAPLFPCTCTPDIVIHTNPSAATVERSARAHAALVAAIKAGLS